MKRINDEASADERTLRISMDAKATVKIGPFARGGKSRVATKAADHDFHAQAKVTPVGIFLPASDEFFLYGVTSKAHDLRNEIIEELILIGRGKVVQN